MQHAVCEIAPHIGTEPPWVRTASAHPGIGETVGDRITAKQTVNRIEVVTRNGAHADPRHLITMGLGFLRSGCRDNGRAGEAAHLLGEFHCLLDKGFDDLRLGHGLDDLAANEDLALTIS